jgi:hypothetical protein
MGNGPLHEAAMAWQPFKLAHSVFHNQSATVNQKTQHAYSLDPSSATLHSCDKHAENLEKRRAIMMAARTSKATQSDHRTPKRAHELGKPDHRKKPRLK